jgi:BirA family biotin operon repressor/biotin-[acetyl-CoA-carboxylase] ligase
MPDDLAAAAARAAARAPMALDVHWVPSLPSTMDAVAEAARAGAGEGFVVVAGAQTAGRGRRGRAWESLPDAGLYVSVLLRPSAAQARALALLTLAVGVGVRRAIVHATGVAPELKWPNDLVVDGRKLAGILAEGHAIGTDAQAVVVGIGINISASMMSDEVARRATSIEEERGQRIARGDLLEAVLADVAAVYDDLRRGGADDILRDWMAAAPSATGARVEWDGRDGPRHGVTAGVDSAGALLVTTSDATERIVGGLVRWI